MFDKIGNRLGSSINETFMTAKTHLKCIAFFYTLVLAAATREKRKNFFEMISDINRSPIDASVTFFTPVIKVMYLRPFRLPVFFFASYGFMKNCQFIARASTPSLISLCQVSFDLLRYFY